MTSLKMLRTDETVVAIGTKLEEGISWNRKLFFPLTGWIIQKD